MLRDKLIRQHGEVDGFRWRNHEVTRVEGFSDAVFGFAVTLLIVSLEVPKTSTELLETMHGFGAFVVTFLMLTGIWYAQFAYFRRYGLEDRFTVVLNLVLLFTVLFFVYPLKFLFSTMLNDPFLRAKISTAHGMELVVLPAHKSILFLIFGAGFTSIFVVFFLLYRHAYERREELELNEFEIYETRHSVRRQLNAVCVGIMYVVISAMYLMPHQTKGEKRLELMASVLVMLIFAALISWMVKMRLERKRIAKNWRERPREE